MSLYSPLTASPAVNDIVKGGLVVLTLGAEVSMASRFPDL